MVIGLTVISAPEKRSIIDQLRDRNNEGGKKDIIPIDMGVNYNLRYDLPVGPPPSCAIRQYDSFTGCVRVPLIEVM